MPIGRTATNIWITHKTVGNDPSVSKLPNMSIELLTWLDAKEYVAQLSASDIPEMQKMAQPYIDMSRLPTTAEIANSPRLLWVIRAVTAASRYYPPISDTTGTLTAYGADIAPYAHIVADKIQKRNNDNSVNPLDPGNLPNPDEWFVQLDMTIRAGRMLNLIDNAIQQAKNKYLSGIRENWTTVTDKVNKHNASQDNTDVMISHILGTEDSNQIPQAFAAVTLEVPIDIKKIEPFTMVPTGIFGQKARRDLKQLVQYGLVNLHTVRANTRGRPKQAVTLSTVGRNLSTALVAHGLI